LGLENGTRSFGQLDDFSDSKDVKDLVWFSFGAWFLIDFVGSFWILSVFSDLDGSSGLG
jgi:hypothetical protein